MFLRILWTANKGQGEEFLMLTPEKYEVLTTEQAIELFMTASKVISELGPLLLSKGIEVQIPEN